jgi:hypothetical protein
LYCEIWAFQTCGRKTNFMEFSTQRNLGLDIAMRCKVCAYYLLGYLVI